MKTDEFDNTYRNAWKMERAYHDAISKGKYKKARVIRNEYAIKATEYRIGKLAKGSKAHKDDLIILKKLKEEQKLLKGKSKEQTLIRWTDEFARAKKGNKIKLNPRTPIQPYGSKERAVYFSEEKDSSPYSSDTLMSSEGFRNPNKPLVKIKLKTELPTRPRRNDAGEYEIKAHSPIEARVVSRKEYKTRIKDGEGFTIKKVIELEVVPTGEPDFYKDIAAIRKKKGFLSKIKYWRKEK